MPEASKTFHKIAFVVPSDHSADHYLRGVVQFATRQQNWLVHCFSLTAADESMRQICAWAPDGVLCFHGSPEASGLQTSAALAKRIGAPFVRLGPLPLNGPSVGAAPESIATLAFEHLTEVGFGRLAHAGAIDRPWTTAVRTEFARLCREADVPVAAWDLPDERQPASVPEVDVQLRSSLEAVTEPTGVLCVPDGIGQVVIQACRVLGIRVPHDVGVVGLGDSVVCPGCVPKLSSIRVPESQIGFQAAALLGDRLRKRRSKSSTVPCREIAERESCRAVSPPIAAALAYIRTHAGPELTVGHVVDATQTVSRVTFEKRFKAELHRTPGAEIRRIRIEQARTLLKDSDLTITEIALQTGWNSGARFAEVFRRVTGMTPTEFRSL